MKASLIISLLVAAVAAVPAADLMEPALVERQNCVTRRRKYHSTSPERPRVSFSNKWAQNPVNPTPIIVAPICFARLRAPWRADASSLKSQKRVLPGYGQGLDQDSGLFNLYLNSCPKFSFVLVP